MQYYVLATHIALKLYVHVSTYPEFWIKTRSIPYNMYGMLFEFVISDVASTESIIKKFFGEIKRL